MTPIKLSVLLVLALPLQLGFLAAHLVLTYKFPDQRFWREILPLAYLTATYLQWLLIAFFISWRTKKYPVPIIMHLPHLLSFLPLVRHVMVAADRQQGEATGLLLAWLHAVATHIFSLTAAWLWQLRSAYRREIDEKRDLVPIGIYAIALITTVLLYAGLDLSFAATAAPLALGIVQLLLYMAITLMLVIRDRHAWSALSLAAAVIFSLANAALLFDRSRSDLGVELALALLHLHLVQGLALVALALVADHAGTGIFLLGGGDDGLGDGGLGQGLFLFVGLRVAHRGGEQQPGHEQPVQGTAGWGRLVHD